jgi:hypothetical protein
MQPVVVRAVVARERCGGPLIMLVFLAQGKSQSHVLESCDVRKKRTTHDPWHGWATQHRLRLVAHRQRCRSRGRSLATAAQASRVI